MKAYKFRIYPNGEQEKLMAQHFGCVRHVYNWALAEKKVHYEGTERNLSRAEVQARMVQSKKVDKPWLNEVNSQSLLASLLNLENAYKKFFQGQNSFPRFKSKYDSEQSFQCPQHVRVDFDANRLFLPKFKQGIRTRFHRRFEGKIKTVTVRRKPSGKYFVSILVDEKKESVKPAPVIPEQTVGIDLGLIHLLIDSEGNKTDNPRFLKASLTKLAKEQRIFVRKKPGSKNRQKQKLKVARVYERVSQQRLDFLHKLTAGLVFKNHATSFAIEDLHVKGMVQNRKLSRSIADVSWGKFKEILSYKCAWAGKNLLTLGRFIASSKVCSQCDYKLETLDLAVRCWECPACHTHHDRDVNAAINIRRLALADALGHSVCVKSSPETRLLSGSVSARGGTCHGSQEAPTIAALAV
jgi:putative transposase